MLYKEKPEIEGAIIMCVRTPGVVDGNNVFNRGRCCPDTESSWDIISGREILVYCLE